MATARRTNLDLSGLEYAPDGDNVIHVRFLQDKDVVATLAVDCVDISFYAKQHLQRKPPLIECGVILSGSAVEKFLIPTGRTRMVGNGSMGVKYYDVTKPIRDDEIEKYERVGIRPPNGVFTYAFFEAQYLARSEYLARSGDPRRGALFLIDPRMIVLQLPMTDAQKSEFQTFGGKKVLYFDVLDVPNLQERKEEIKRCRQRGDNQRRQHEEADKRWEAEMEERLAKKAVEDEAKPKLSKKAKQKVRQAKRREGGDVSLGEREEREGTDDEALQERLHKQRQAESKARAEEDARRERDLEAERKKLEAAEARRAAEAEVLRMHRVKNLLQKVQSSLNREPANRGGDDEDAYESSAESVGSQGEFR